MPAQVAGCAQVDLATEKAAQLQLDRGDSQQAGSATGFELDKEVDVAIGMEVVSQRRSEEGESCDAMALTKVGQSGAVDHDSFGETHDPIFSRRNHDTEMVAPDASTSIAGREMNCRRAIDRSEIGERALFWRLLLGARGDGSSDVDSAAGALDRLAGKSRSDIVWFVLGLGLQRQKPTQFLLDTGAVAPGLLE
jgi:hypothetical protein